MYFKEALQSCCIHYDPFLILQTDKTSGVQGVVYTSLCTQDDIRTAKNLSSLATEKCSEV